MKQKLPGVYVQPSYRSALSKEDSLLIFSGSGASDTNLGLNCFLFFPTVWFGVIFIRHGLYQDGVFKFTVYIPDNYPDGDCPVSKESSLPSFVGAKAGALRAGRISWLFFLSS